jgi:hypothetical protein
MPWVEPVADVFCVFKLKDDNLRGVGHRAQAIVTVRCRPELPLSGIKITLAPAEAPQ